MDTGFGVNGSAVRYNWAVRVTAPGYDRTWDYGGGLWFRSTWTNTDGYDNIPNGSYDVRAYVSGNATLSNGLVCASGNPTDLQGIF